jgi:hypothetical protein
MQPLGNHDAVGAGGITSPTSMTNLGAAQVPPGLSGLEQPEEEVNFEMIYSMYAISTRMDRKRICGKKHNKILRLGSFH